MPPCTRARSRRVTNFQADDAPARRHFGNEVGAVVAVATNRTVAACADRPTKHTRCRAVCSISSITTTPRPRRPSEAKSPLLPPWRTAARTAPRGASSETCTRANARRVANCQTDDAPARRHFGSEAGAVVAVAPDSTVAARADPGAAAGTAAATAHARRGAVRPKDCRVLAMHTEGVTANASNAWWPVPLPPLLLPKHTPVGGRCGRRTAASSQCTPRV